MSQPPETDLSTAAARTVADAVEIPPRQLSDDPAGYIEWLRHRTAPVRPSRRRERPQWINPDQFRLRGRRGRVAADERPEGYDDAAAKLRQLADFGAASLEAARAELGDDSLYTARVMWAAEHPVTPTTTADDQAAVDRPADAPSCEACGTALEPDGTCFTCTTTTANGLAS